MHRKIDEWAIVVGGGVNALGVVRSLGSEAVRVAVVCKDSPGIGASSRYAKWRACGVDYAELPQHLEHLVQELGGRPVLFLTEEEAVRVVSAARDRLSRLLRVRFAPHDMVLALTHKEGVQELAELHGMPIPRAVRLQNPRDYPKLSGLRFPCVVKPGLKHAGYGALFKKAYVVQDVQRAIDLFAKMAPVLPDLVVQEWIEGADDSIYFCLQYMGADRRAVASFTGRKLRAYPPQVGGTASCEAAPEAAAELESLNQRFFSAVGLQGMASIEYKRDVRDGRFYVVEPTVGRTDFQQEVATVNGHNLVYAAYCYECGASLPAVRTLPVTIWREPVTDRWSEQLQGAHPSFREHPVVDAYWRWRDPAPWLHFTWSRVRQRLRRVYA
jgi:predicted ATP-grasp superfamily ATP-dependent carboligase